MKHETIEFTSFPGVSEFVYSREDFAKIREIIYKESANVLPPTKSTLVYSRLAPLVRASGTATFSAYIDHIRTDAAERHKAVCALTTNHTGFFREDHHFEHFAEEVRPALLQKIQAGQPVRMWSAGSSSGEEVYSLTMTLLGSDRITARRIQSADVALLATDLADHVLEKARAARYDADALAPVPSDLRAEWLTLNPDGSGVVRDEVRKMVRFKPLNLIGPWPIRRPFDVIFCRNVMIYFDQETKETLINRFAEQLLPGGHLYIGHSERVTGPAADSLASIGKTIYRKIK